MYICIYIYIYIYINKNKTQGIYFLQVLFRFLPNLQRLYKITKSVKSINLKKKLIKIEKKKNKNCNKK